MLTTLQKGFLFVQSSKPYNSEEICSLSLSAQNLVWFTLQSGQIHAPPFFPLGFESQVQISHGCQLALRRAFQKAFIVVLINGQY